MTYRPIKARKLTAHASSYICSLIIVCLTLCLSACSGSGSTSPSSNSSTVVIGTLPNGSTVYSSSASFTESVSGEPVSGTIGIIGGTPGVSYTISFNPSTVATSSIALPNVALTPTPCILISGSLSQTTCTMLISPNGAESGTYNLNPIATADASGDVTTLNPLKFILTGNGGSQPTLGITINNTNVIIGESTSGTVMLSNSSGVSELNVSITSNDPSIAIESPSVCTLSTSSPSCPITISGESNGNTYIKVSASGYTTVNSSTLNIYQQITPTFSSPTLGSTNTYSAQGVQVSFSGSIESSTLSTSTFIVRSHSAPTTDIPGTFQTTSSNSVVTFVPTTALTFNESYIVSTTSEILDSYGNPVLALSPISFHTQESYIIYVATNGGTGWSGNLMGYVSGAANGVAAADSLCQADSKCPIGSSCQAMIVDSAQNRKALPNHINWVLESNTPYMNESGQLIGVTTTSAIFLTSTGLINPFSQTPTTPLTAWTGLEATWYTYNGTCNSWATMAESLSAPAGTTTATNYQSITGIVLSDCNESMALYCVQQP